MFLKFLVLSCEECFAPPLPVQEECLKFGQKLFDACVLAYCNAGSVLQGALVDTITVFLRYIES